MLSNINKSKLKDKLSSIINIQTRKIKTIISWIAVLLRIFTIYKLSSQTATTSGSVSRGIVKYGVEIGIRLTKAQIIEPEKWRIIDNRLCRA